MWQKLLQMGLVKDVCIFAGAYGAIHVVRQLRREKASTAFDAFPTVVAQGYDRILMPLLEFDQPVHADEVFRATEAFLVLASSGTVRRDGFRVNHLGNDISRKAKLAIEVTKRGPREDAALAAVHYERDYLPVLESMVEDTVQNMLMDHVA